MKLDELLNQTIRKAIQQDINDKIEVFVKNEVIKELRRRGVDIDKNPRSINNKQVGLYDKRDYRSKVGSLDMTRIKNGLMETLQFRLKGLQARNPKDRITDSDLNKMIETALKKFKF